MSNITENEKNEEEKAIEFLKQLLKTPSISGNEKEIAQIIKNFLINSDFSIIPSNVGNVIGIKGQGNPILLISSHMDTVPTNNPYLEKDNKIYATGAVDCKPSLAAMIFSVSQIDFAKFQGTIVIAGIVQEEISTIGITDLFKQLEKRGIQPNYAIFGEPTHFNRICIGYRGRISLKITVRTEPGHSSSAWGFDNGIVIIYEIYQKIKTLEFEHNKYIAKEQGHFSEISINITKIQAGHVNNSLPSKTECEIDIRIPMNINASEIMNTINEKITNFKNNNQPHLQPSTQIEVEYYSKFNACEVSPDTPIVNALRWAAFKETKEKIQMIKKTGSTFTNIIQEYYHQSNPDFACITYGPGDPRLEHTNQEFIDKEEFIRTIGIYKHFYSKMPSFFQRFIKK